MPKFLFKASYSTDGIKGLRAEGGTARVTAIEALARSAGGQLEAAYFALGGADFYAIAELPDNASAAAIVTASRAAGAVDAAEAVVLLTPSEMDEAATKQLDYRPPGR